MHGTKNKEDKKPNLVVGLRFLIAVHLSPTLLLGAAPLRPVGPDGRLALADKGLDDLGPTLQVLAETPARLVAHLEQQLGADTLGVLLPVTKSFA